jgi:hypothetical protein
MALAGPEIASTHKPAAMKTLRIIVSSGTKASGLSNRPTSPRRETDILANRAEIRWANATTTQQRPTITKKFKPTQT